MKKREEENVPNCKAFSEARTTAEKLWFFIQDLGGYEKSTLMPHLRIDFQFLEANKF